MENTEKPVAKVVGEDGNVFVTLGICTKALRKAGQSDKVKELTDRVFASHSYDEALSIMMDYCELQ